MVKEVRRVKGDGVEDVPGSGTRVERFRDVYEANYSRVLGYALRRTGSPDDAADAVAETFLTAWRRLDHLPEGADARLWLYGVARRVLANSRRAEMRRGRLVARLQSNSDTDDLASRDSEAVTFLEAVTRAFRALREADRDVLGLSVWESLSYKELGAVLGCTAGAARIRAHRARRRLASELERMGIDVKRSTASGHVWIDGRSPVTRAEEAW